MHRALRRIAPDHAGILESHRYRSFELHAHYQSFDVGVCSNGKRAEGRERLPSDSNAVAPPVCQGFADVSEFIRIGAFDRLLLRSESQQTPAHTTSLNIYRLPQDPGRNFMRELYTRLRRFPVSAAPFNCVLAGKPNFQHLAVCTGEALSELKKLYGLESPITPLRAVSGDSIHL
jgi:hypothetical protein